VRGDRGKRRVVNQRRGEGIGG
jgi:hypothetical protein